MLLPFTYDLDPHAAFALLLGLGATTTTADPISAILFGVPGHAASAATTLDGYPLTRQGQAGRALGASYMSALMGGLFGAALMGVSLPILRPLMLYIGSPELLAFAVFGLSMVAVLSGNAPLRGLAAGCFGVMLSMVGEEAQTGTQRWTLDSLFLADGLPLVPLVLGIFALPELCDLAIARTAVVTDGGKIDAKTGMLLGVKDCFTHWFLILRCSWIGSFMGAIPGIAVSIIDWISYAHALRTEKGAPLTFGKGDIRGVIAAESATNAREGGALVPMVAFGVPTSAGMAVLLGAFLIHGLVPGPDMLGKNLDVTYSMVWSIAIANILGSGLCFLFSGQFAKLATLRYTLIMPVVLSLVFIGAFEGGRQWGDLYALLCFGARRLGDEALPMAAAAAGAGLHPRQGHRALPVHLDPALRNRLDAASGRDRHVHARLGRSAAVVPRRRAGPWRRAADARGLRRATVRTRQSASGGADLRRRRDVAGQSRLGHRSQDHSDDRRRRRERCSAC